MFCEMACVFMKCMIKPVIVSVSWVSFQSEMYQCSEYQLLTAFNSSNVQFSYICHSTSSAYVVFIHRTENIRSVTKNIITF